MLRASSEEVDKKFEQAQELIGKGTPITEALQKADISHKSFLIRKRKMKKAGMKTGKRKYTKRAAFIDIPMKPAASSKVAIVICSPDQISEIVDGLK